MFLSFFLFKVLSSNRQNFFINHSQWVDKNFPSKQIAKLLDLDFCRLTSLTSVVRLYTFLFSFVYFQALINVMTMCSSKKLVGTCRALFFNDC